MGVCLSVLLHLQKHIVSRLATITYLLQCVQCSRMTLIQSLWLLLGYV